MKQAKIKLSADIQGFNKAIEDAKKNLSSINSIKIDGGFAKKLKENVQQQLGDVARSIKEEMNGIEAVLAKTAKNMDKGFDPKKATELTNRLDQLKRKYEEVAKAAKEAGDAGGVGGGADAGGAGAGGMISGGIGKIGKLLTGVGLGFGVMSLFERRVQMASERLDIRAGTGGADLISEKSALGYTPSERRIRAAELARSARGDMSAGQITGVTDFSEQLSRAYGIQTGTQGGVIGAARTMGERNSEKALRDTFAAAVKAGMEGGNIERYMQAQTSYLEEMSSGVNIDTSSLQGFAAEIGNIPFFKSDPNRIFDAIRGMNDAFVNGDRFQQGQAMRALQSVAPGSSPGALELRRSMGLFANTKQLQSSLKGLEGHKGFASLNAAFGVGGSDIINAQFKEAAGMTEKEELGSRIGSIMERLGLKGMGGQEIATRLLKNPNAKISEKDLMTAQLSPEEQIKRRLDKGVYTGMEKGVKDVQASIDALKDVMANDVAKAITSLADAIAHLGIGTEMGGHLAVGAGIAGAAAGLGAGKLLKGAGGAMKGAGKAMGKGAKAAGKGFGKAAGFVGRNIPFIATLVNGGFAIKDAYDLYQTYQETGKIDNAQAAMLLADVIGMVPLPGAGMVGAAVSTGLEFAPKGALGSIDVGGGSSAGAGAMMPAATGDIANTIATADNTAAINNLTAAIMSGVGAGGTKSPSYARPVGNSTMGK